jgi:hypothetical protein
MVNDEMLDFIRGEREYGVSEEEIERELIQEGGWDSSDVREAFLTLGVSKSVPQEKPAPHSTLVPLAVKHEKAEPKFPDADIAPFRALPNESTSAILNTPRSAPEEQHEDFLGIFSETTSAPIEQTSPQGHVQKLQPLDIRQVTTPPMSQSPSVHSSVTIPAEATAESSSHVNGGSGLTPPSFAPKDGKVLIARPERTFAPPDVSKMNFALTGVLGGEQKKTPVLTEQSTDVPVALSPKAETRTTIDIRSLKSSPVTPTPTSVKTPEEKPTVMNLLSFVSKKASGEPLRTTPMNTKDVATDSIGVSSTETVPPPETKSQIAGILLGGLIKEKINEESSTQREVSAITQPVRESETTKMEQAIRPQISAPKIFSTPPAELFEKKQKAKKLIILIGGTLISLLTVGGVLAYFFGGLRVNTERLFAESITKFAALGSFSYQANITTDLVLIATDPNGEVNTGTVKFSATSEGSLLNTGGGFGDGDHHARFAGGLQSGDFNWSTDVTLDLRLIGSALYAHILSLPPNAQLDQKTAGEYWLRLSLAELARELSLVGLEAKAEGYGALGGTQSGGTLIQNIMKELPFSIGEKLDGEMVGGVSTDHYRLVPNTDGMIAVFQAQYQNYKEKKYLMTEEEAVRLSGALSRMTGEIWIDRSTGLPRQIALRVELNDVLREIRVQGVIETEFIFSNLNAPVKVEVPVPALSLEEFKVHLDDGKKRFESRARDEVKIEYMKMFTAALGAHRLATGKYPVLLSELVSGGQISTSTIPETDLKEFLYASYVSETMRTKNGRCATQSKNCDHYHIGIDLETLDHEELNTDADQVDGIEGLDTAGCSLEKERACYDLVSAPLNSSSSQ